MLEYDENAEGYRKDPFERGFIEGYIRGQMQANIDIMHDVYKAKQKGKEEIGDYYEEKFPLEVRLEFERLAEKYDGMNEERFAAAVNKETEFLLSWKAYGDAAKLKNLFGEDKTASAF